MGRNKPVTASKLLLAGFRAGRGLSPAPRTFSEGEGGGPEPGRGWGKLTWVWDSVADTGSGPRGTRDGWQKPGFSLPIGKAAGIPGMDLAVCRTGQGWGGSRGAQHPVFPGPFLKLQSDLWARDIRAHQLPSWGGHGPDSIIPGLSCPSAAHR